MCCRGTDLIVHMTSRLQAPKVVVDIKNIVDLRRITEGAAGFQCAALRSASMARSRLHCQGARTGGLRRDGICCTGNIAVIQKKSYQLRYLYL
jgi:hypothetical protein